MGKKKTRVGPSSKKKNTADHLRLSKSNNLLAHQLLYSTPCIELPGKQSFIVTPIQAAVLPKKTSKVGGIGRRKNKKMCWICRKASSCTDNFSESDIEFKQRVFTPNFLASFNPRVSPSLGGGPCNTCSKIVDKVIKMMKQITDLESKIGEEVLRVRTFIKLNWNLENDIEKDVSPRNEYSEIPVDPLAIDPLEYEEFFEPPFSDNAEDNYSEEDVKPLVLDCIDMDEFSVLPPAPIEVQNDLNATNKSRRKRRNLKSAPRKTDISDDSVELLPQKRKCREKAEKLVQKLILEELLNESDSKEAEDNYENDPVYKESENNEDNADTILDEEVRVFVKKAKVRKRKDNGKPIRIRRKKEDIPKGPFPCVKCQKYFKKERNQIIHQVTVCKLEISEEELKRNCIKFHQCKTCEKKFSDAKDLVKHIRIHTGDTPFKCKCGKSFTQKATLTFHQKNICFEDKDLKKQKREEYVAKFKSVDRPFKCEQCPRRFIHEKNRNIHIENHNNIKTKRKKNLACKRQCHVCGDVFDRAKKFQNHVNHVHDGVRNFQCQQCTKTFFENFQLKKHVRRVHENLSFEFVCEVSGCKRKFNFKKYLENHTNRVHKRIMHFACDVCNKQFHARHQLKIHGRTHARKSKTRASANRNKQASSQPDSSIIPISNDAQASVPDHNPTPIEFIRPNPAPTYFICTNLQSNPL